MICPKCKSSMLADAHATKWTCYVCENERLRECLNSVIDHYGDTLYWCSLNKEWENHVSKKRKIVSQAKELIE